jgi:hypothetical protein
MSTLPGVPFYRSLGFTEVERVLDTLPDGVTVDFLRMTRAVLCAKSDEQQHRADGGSADDVKSLKDWPAGDPR